MRTLMKIVALATAAFALNACQRDADRASDEAAAAAAAPNVEAASGAEEMVSPVQPATPKAGATKKGEAEKAAAKR